MIRFYKTKMRSDEMIKISKIRQRSDQIRCAKEVKLSARAYFGLAALGETLLAFGGRGADDQALASVGGLRDEDLGTW